MSSLIIILLPFKIVIKIEAHTKKIEPEYEEYALTVMQRLQQEYL